MKNIVSFETAKALKYAGFPQTPSKWGQFWYNSSEMLFIGERQRLDIENYVFAPTATDILQELPENYYLGKDSDGFNIKEFLWFGDSGYEFSIVSHSDNPAEAAAAAWLALKNFKKMKNITEQLTEMQEFINSLKEPAKIEAAKKFPDFPKAQSVWVKLRTLNGGIEEVVETLGLTEDHEKYLRDVYAHMRAGDTKAASLCVGRFADFCLNKLEENFYLFK